MESNEICFELIELGLITCTQIEIGFELIELGLITSTQMKIGFELAELKLITPTQMNHYFIPIYYTMVRQNCKILFSLCLSSDYFLLTG